MQWRRDRLSTTWAADAPADADVHRLPEITATAVTVADWYLAHIPADRVSYWDFDNPHHPEYGP